MAVAPGVHAVTTAPLSTTVTSETRPNIVFLFADDLPASAIHPEQNRPVKTPALDRLASQGLAFKLIEYNVNGSRHTQLFDLQTDPEEMVNLAHNEKYSDIKARLSARMQEYRHETKDTGEF